MMNKMKMATILFLITFITACNQTTIEPDNDVQIDTVPTEVPTTEPDSAAQQAQNADFLAEAAAKVESATRPTSEWDGPVTGPLAQTDKLIVYVSENQANGGIAGVAKGVEEAAQAIGWEFQLIDAAGSNHVEAFQEAMALNPDGIIIGGIDVFELALEVEEAHEQGIEIVGWHVIPDPGPVPGLSLFTNIATPSQDVAEIAAMYAVAESGGTAGVVVFTDTRFQIAVAKSNAMAEVIRQCQSCNLLSIEDVLLNETEQRMPEMIDSLLAQYGDQWTYALGINDLYFDHSETALNAAGIPTTGRLESVSAGDGSESAYERIRNSNYQVGTVPEPLLFHGWQLVDELNRAFAGEPPSGYVAPVHLVTPDNIAFDGGPNNVYDPDNGYRNEYQAIWQQDS